MDAKVKKSQSIISNSAEKVVESNYPVFLMNLPLSLDCSVANNIYMGEIEDEERTVDTDLSIRQFKELYGFISTHAFVYMLPSSDNFQDQVYVSNLGAVLFHDHKKELVLSKFKSNPRVGEEIYGKEFFKLMGIEAHVPPATFEGEADLKYLSGNTYVGSVGSRTSSDSLDWMEAEFGINVIHANTQDPYLYHLDCAIMPITKSDTLVCVDSFSRSVVKNIEKYTNIIPVTIDEARYGVTGGLRLNNYAVFDSSLETMIRKRNTEKYDYEKARVKKLEEITSTLNLELNIFNMSEFEKSGASVSCMFMLFNRSGFSF